MRKQRKPESHLIGELRAMTERKFGLTKTAQELGFTRSYICEVVKGRRGVSERLASEMGYRRVVEFEKF